MHLSNYSLTRDDMIELPELSPNRTKDKITDFIKNIRLESKSYGIAIGLSGGLDSTIVAYLLKEAIGSESIFGIHMSTPTTPKEDKKHSKLIAKNLNIEYKEIAIDNLLNEFTELSADFSPKIEKKSSGKGIDFLTNGKKNEDLHRGMGVMLNNYNERRYENIRKIAEGNLKARIRMSFLYYYANLNNFLVAGTGNRSELLIGYFTKYGDGAADILPIANIYKSQLKKLAIDWNIPKEIINKPPRAGLWDGQTDEDEIGLSYEILDRILYLLVDKKLDTESISKETNISHWEIDMVKCKVDDNRHKLQFPLSPDDM